MVKEGIKDNIIKDECPKDNKKEKKTKILFHSEYDEPGVEDEFGPLWGPGSKYKPWING